MKIQEKSESFYFFPEIPCTRSNYLDVRIFRYSDIYSDIYNIYNIYSPPKFSRTCSTNTLMVAFKSSELIYIVDFFCVDNWTS